MVVLIRKADILKFDASLYIFKRYCSLLIKNVYLRVHNLHKPFDTGHPPLELLRKLNDPPDGG